MSTLEATSDSDGGSSRDRSETAMERSGAELVELLEALAECHQGLARVVQVRVGRPWTNYEHDAYLRLRTERTELSVRLQQAQRRFERARASVRNAKELNESRGDAV